MISESRVKLISQLEKQISEVSKLLNRTKKNSNQVGLIRLIVFFGGLISIFSFYFFLSTVASIVCFVVIAVGFISVSIRQSKILSLIAKYNVWIEIKKSCLARINLDWGNIPHFKDFSDLDISPLEMDLDLTGYRSLHQLLDFSKSSEGSKLLRKMLIEHPNNSKDIFERQSIVKELLNMSHFRNKFLLTNYLTSKKEIESSGFLSWLALSNKEKVVKGKLKLLTILCMFNLVVILLSFLQIIPPFWSVTTLLYWGFYLLNNKHIKPLAAEAETIGNELKKIIASLGFVENYKFGKNSNLIKLCSPLSNKNAKATLTLNKIQSVLSMLAYKANPMLWPLFVMIWPIDYYLAYRVEKLKKEIADKLPGWLDVLYHLEAYISIANFAYLNPDYSFPQIYSDEAGNSKIHLKGEEIAHPLISPNNKISNSYSIDGLGVIHIITGSNMSGKSTFLRTLGINLCLAYAGSAVNAIHFSTSIVRLFTCIKVSDSVIDGISYFYAEVKRLKELLEEIEALNKRPVLFMIDEIFKGTNNLERLTGSRAMIKALANKNGAGLISTHDLELVKLSEELNSISNFHFKEEIENEKMIFDYKLRSGPCPTTNALKIMRINGLPIE